MMIIPSVSLTYQTSPPWPLESRPPDASSLAGEPCPAAAGDSPPGAAPQGSAPQGASGARRRGLAAGVLAAGHGDLAKRGARHRGGRAAAALGLCTGVAQIADSLLHLHPGVQPCSGDPRRPAISHSARPCVRP